MRRVTARSAAPSPSRVVTVGAGASPLVGDLLAAGYVVIAVDIAQAALDALGAALSEPARRVAAERLTTVVADVRELRLAEAVDVWHDRAVFHFFVQPADRAAYVTAAAHAVRRGGHLVIATFAPDGPTRCSGLPVMRHDTASLRETFDSAFDLVDSAEADHVTPSGGAQRFTHAVLQRR